MSVNAKGGAFRGKEHKDTTTASYKCPICGKMNTKRKSFVVRGARFCKLYENEYTVLSILEKMSRRKAEKQEEAA